MFSMISMKQLEMYLDREMRENPGSGMGGNLTLLDVRMADEFGVGHLTGAINIPLEELEYRFYELNRDRPVIVYCGHGSKSLMAARFLDRMGYLVMAAAGGLDSYRGRYYKSI